MGKIKNKIREDLMKEVERKKDLLEFHTMLEEEIDISDIVLKFNQLVYLKIDISIQSFNDFVSLLIKKRYYDENIVVNCEKFIINNSIVSTNICGYLVDAYSAKGIFTDYTIDAVDVILAYCKEVNIINKIKIGVGLKNVKIDSIFIESFLNYYKLNKSDSFIIDSIKQVCNVVYILPVEIVGICYEVYLDNSLKETSILEKILFSALMKDIYIFKDIVYKCGDEYIDYCNEKNEYSKERTMILLEMYKEHKVCNIDMLTEFLKYEVINKNDELSGVFDRAGKEIVSMYQKNKKMYYKVGFCDSFILRYGDKDRIFEREILNIYFDSVIMNMYRNSKDFGLKRFCCEKCIDENMVNEKLLKDYIDIGSDKIEYMILANELLLKKYFENLSSNYDSAKAYVNKYIEIVQKLEGGSYKNYVKNYIIGLIEDENLNEAKNIVFIIEKNFLKDYINVITSILFKSIERKELDGLMDMFEILLFIDAEQLGFKSIQGLFVKYLRSNRFINKKYNETIISFYKESNNANKREILGIVLEAKLEDVTLLLRLYEIEDSKVLENILIEKFNDKDIIYPIEIQRKLIDKNKNSLDIVLRLLEGVSEDEIIYDQIYNIANKLYTQDCKAIIASILKNIIKYEKARVAWIKLNQPIVDVYSLGQIKISNKYLQVRGGESIFSTDKVLVIKIENDYKEKLEKYIVKEDLYLKGIGEYYILDYMETTNELFDMNIENILQIFNDVMNIHEEWKNDNVYIYNPEIDKFIISKHTILPLGNFIIKGEGHILPSREVNDISKKIGQTITRKEAYDESITCKVYVKFFSSLLEEWSRLKILNSEIDDVLYRKINFIYENLLQEDIIRSFEDMKVGISKIDKVVTNKNIDVLTMKEKLDNFYMFNEEDKNKIFSEIIEKNITNDECIKIIIDNISNNCIGKECLKYLIDAFTPKIYDECEIKNILAVLDIIENYSNSVLWDDELEETIECFLDSILKNKKLYNIFIKNAI